MTISVVFWSGDPVCERKADSTYSVNAGAVVGAQIRLFIHLRFCFSLLAFGSVILPVSLSRQEAGEIHPFSDPFVRDALHSVRLPAGEHRHHRQTVHWAGPGLLPGAVRKSRGGVVVVVVGALHWSVKSLVGMTAVWRVSCRVSWWRCFTVSWTER